jgi:hypothetical protein
MASTNDAPPVPPGDAGPPRPIATFIARARGHSRAPGAARLVRVVVRLDRLTVDRLDALRPRFPDASRAGLVRAFVAFGVEIAEEHVKRAEGGAP